MILGFFQLSDPDDYDLFIGPGGYPERTGGDPYIKANKTRIAKLREEDPLREFCSFPSFNDEGLDNLKVWHLALKSCQLLK